VVIVGDPVLLVITAALDVCGVNPLKELSGRFLIDIRCSLPHKPKSSHPQKKKKHSNTG
jgi:hypothetical protein